MQNASTRNFGLLIAYVVPGFVALVGLGFVSEDVQGWLLGVTPEGPTLGGFLYVTVASVTGGMVSNAVRWALIDTAHHLPGLARPEWSDAALHERVTAYEWLVENHYRHYQFYGNTVCALIFAHACWRAGLAGTGNGLGWTDGATVALLLVLIAGSRSTLARYYRRSASLLSEIRKGTHDMANGGHPKPPKAETKGTQQGGKPAAEKPSTK
mgnify:CR=1 FL=1